LPYSIKVYLENLSNPDQYECIYDRQNLYSYDAIQCRVALQEHGIYKFHVYLTTEFNNKYVTYVLDTQAWYLIEQNFKPFTFKVNPFDQPDEDTNTLGVFWLYPLDGVKLRQAQQNIVSYPIKIDSTQSGTVSKTKDTLGYFEFIDSGHYSATAFYDEFTDILLIVIHSDFPLQDIPEVTLYNLKNKTIKPLWKDLRINELHRILNKVDNEVLDVYRKHDTYRVAFRRSAIKDSRLRLRLYFNSFQEYAYVNAFIDLDWFIEPEEEEEEEINEEEEEINEEEEDEY